LESESNKKCRHDKFNRVDLKAKNNRDEISPYSATVKVISIKAAIISVIA
jgi:hypothetical protein